MKIYLELEQQVVYDTICNDVFTVTETLLEKKREFLWREFMNLEEEATKQALIELGWTPPDEKKEPQ